MEPQGNIWRLAAAGDDDAVVSMCVALNSEDPGPNPAMPVQIRRTIRSLRDQPWRGRVVVCDIQNRLVGYALLISFWSNELGGEVCIIDELFVLPAYRGQGLATLFVERLARNDRSLWPAEAAALALEVTPQNHRARILYERLGFEGGNVSMRLRLTPSR